MAANDWVPVLSAGAAFVLSIRQLLIEWRKSRAVPRKRKHNA
jgi:hypothetical protein